MNNWIGPIVWNDAMLHNFFRFVINTTAAIFQRRTDLASVQALPTINRFILIATWANTALISFY